MIVYRKKLGPRKKTNYNVTLLVKHGPISFDKHSSQTATGFNQSRTDLATVNGQFTKVEQRKMPDKKDEKRSPNGPVSRN